MGKHRAYEPEPPTPPVVVIWPSDTPEGWEQMNRAAYALWRAEIQYSQLPIDSSINWETLPETEKNMFRRHARTMLDSLETPR